MRRGDRRAVGSRRNLLLASRARLPARRCVNYDCVFKFSLASELNQRTRVSRGELDPLFGDFLRAMGASSLAAGRQPRGVATDTCAENITIRDPMTGRRGPAEPHRARHWRAQIHGARVAVEAPTDASRSRLAVVEAGAARWRRPRQRWRSKITVFGTRETIETATVSATPTKFIRVG